MAQTDRTDLDLPTLPEMSDYTDGIVDESAPKSLMETLRQARREAEKGRFYELEIPMYRGLVAIRFSKELTFDDIDRIMTKATRSKKSADALDAQIDILVKCTNCFRIRGSVDEEYVTLEDENGVVGWGSTLLNYLGLPHAATARTAVKVVFGNDIAIMSAQKIVFEWIQGGLVDGAGAEVTGE